MNCYKLNLRNQKNKKAAVNGKKEMTNVRPGSTLVAIALQIFIRWDERGYPVRRLDVCKTSDINQMQVSFP